MREIKTTTISVLAVGMLAGSVVAVVAQDEATEGDNAVPADARIVDLTVDYDIQQDAEKVVDIPVTPGETVVFRVDNVDGYEHNFYVGTDEELTTKPSKEEVTAYIEAERAAGRPLTNLPLYPATDVGIPTWQSGVQEVVWQVPEDITDLKFGCTITSHYSRMQGTFSVLE